VPVRTLVINIYDNFAINYNSKGGLEYG